MILSSDKIIYRNDKFPNGISVCPVDVTKSLEKSTCLDMYLDQVMANVPELALAMHAKGFIRRVHVCHTNDIPWLNTSILPCSGANSRGSDLNDVPMFDSKMVEFNAMTILNFLKDSCSKEDDGTYLLKRSSDGQLLHIYDLEATNIQQQRKFKWLLAMVSHRFAIRIGQYLKNSSKASHQKMRARQKKLFENCFKILGDLKEIGGESHDTIRASVLEQIADISLSRVDAYRAGSLHDDDHEFNLIDELTEATELLENSMGCLQLALASNGKEDQTRNEGGGVNNVHKTDSYENTNAHSDSKKLIIGEVKVDIGSEGELTPIDDDNIGDNEEDGTEEAIEMIALQLSGCFYKRVHTLSLIIVEKLKDTRVQECLNLLQKLIPACSIWVDMIKKAKGYSNWAADVTVMESLPIVWALLGEVCREISNGRGFVTPSEASFEIMYIVEKWKELSLASLGFSFSDCEEVKVSDVFRSEIEWIWLSNKLNLNDDNYTTKFLQFLHVSAHSLTYQGTLSSSPLKSNVSKLNSWAIQESSSDEDEDTPKNDYGEVRALTPVPSPCLCKDGILHDVQDETLGILSIVCYCFAWSAVFYDLSQYDNASNGNVNGVSGVRIELNFSQAEKILEAEKVMTKINIASKSNGATSTGINRLKDNRSLQIVRQIADSCNAYAQRLLSLSVCDIDVSAIGCDPQSTRYKNNRDNDVHISDLTIRKLLLAEDYLNMALFLFRVTKDNLNVSTVLLNGSCLMRKFAKLVSIKTFIQYPNDALDRFLANLGFSNEANEVEMFLNRGISLCNEAHIGLGEKGDVSNIKTFQVGNDVQTSFRHLPRHLNLIWEGISNEIAICYLCIGVNRKSFMQRHVHEDSASVHTRLEKSFVEPIQMASKIFSDLKSDRMVALCDFHIGFYYCHRSYDVVNAKKADLKLENALKYYHRAYNYYTKYDIGPTLLIILIDLSNLYLTTFNVSENAIYAYAEQVKLSRESLELMDAKSKSISSSDHDKYRQSEATEMVISLLGGAFQTLLESRFAFTPAVIQIHGAEEINKFVKRVITPLSQVLMKILKCISLNIITINVDNDADAELKSLRSVCVELLRIDVAVEAANSIPIQTSRLYELLDILNSSNGLKHAMRLT